MQIWTDRYLVILAIVGVVLSIGIGYQYAMNLHRISVVSPSCALQSSPLFLLQSTQLPSVIPYYRVAAQRHLFFPVDLHRVDLTLDIQKESSPTILPLMDKVLFVPKTFKREKQS
jgi:hypothetical protein